MCLEKENPPRLCCFDALHRKTKLRNVITEKLREVLEHIMHYIVVYSTTTSLEYLKKALPYRNFL